jgi:XTP/dITP diphosphohydrolase
MNTKFILQNLYFYWKYKRMKLVFATNNQHKLNEIRAILDGGFELVGLNEIGCFDDIPEDQQTLEGNASQKAFYVFNKFGLNCFADDTGLEIDALGGEPGVFSARYAGGAKNPEANMDKVLGKLSKINNRKARFRTVISLVIDGEEKLFEGIVEGTILREKHGQKGFGYDPVFKPDGYEETFAEMDLSVKNKISHRGRAVEKLVEHLKSLRQYE